MEGLFEARPEHFNQPWPTLRTETFVQMVFGSICKLGRATQQAIVTDTKLHKDTVGLAIADLLLWNKRIGTAIDQHGDTRVYFAREAKR